MNQVDTHGLKMTGLQEASKNTQDYGYLSGFYEEIFYDRGTGEVWTVSQYCLGMNDWTRYHDPQIIKVGNIQAHLTMQQIADWVADRVKEEEETHAERGKWHAWM